MDSNILEAKNILENTKWTIYRHISPSGKVYIYWNYFKGNKQKMEIWYWVF